MQCSAGENGQDSVCERAGQKYGTVYFLFFCLPAAETPVQEFCLEPLPASGWRRFNRLGAIPSRQELLSDLAETRQRNRKKHLFPGKNAGKYYSTPQRYTERACAD